MLIKNSLLTYITSSLLCLCFCSITEAKMNYSSDVVMFGDSLVEYGNWNELFSDVEIVNLGRGGDSTNDLLKRINEVYKQRPKYCFILVGFNDIDTYRSMDDIYNNYVCILKKIKNKKITPVILSTTYADDSFKQVEQINQKINILNDKMKNYALNNQITYIDVNKEITKDGFLMREYAFDHVHLNKKAYEILRDKILDTGVIEK